MEVPSIGEAAPDHHDSPGNSFWTERGGALQDSLRGQVQDERYPATISQDDHGAYIHWIVELPGNRVHDPFGKMVIIHPNLVRPKTDRPLSPCVRARRRLARLQRRTTKPCKVVGGRRLDDQG